MMLQKLAVSSRQQLRLLQQILCIGKAPCLSAQCSDQFYFGLLRGNSCPSTSRKAFAGLTAASVPISLHLGQGNALSAWPRPRNVLLLTESLPVTLGYEEL